MRIGVISPNIVSNVADYNAMQENPKLEWPFDTLAKKSALLFDRLFVTENLELTCEIVSNSYASDENPLSALLRYLTQKNILFHPSDLGYTSHDEFLKDNLIGDGYRLHEQLKKVGNLSNNCEPGETTYLGQPDISDFEAHDGNHPRSQRYSNPLSQSSPDPAIRLSQEKYESLLLRRNVALLKQAGVKDIALVSEVPGSTKITKQTHPVWRVVINEMPEMSMGIPWIDVLGFRDEHRTQHLIRSLRRWVRKVVTEDWTEHELQDEIQELVFEYEQHLVKQSVFGTTSKLSFVICGIGEISEDLVKLRISRIARLVSAAVDKRKYLADPTTPGHELALIPEIKRFTEIS